MKYCKLCDLNFITGHACLPSFNAQVALVYKQAANLAKRANKYGFELPKPLEVTQGPIRMKISFEKDQS